MPAMGEAAHGKSMLAVCIAQDKDLIMMPKQKPGKSEQVVRTPSEFLVAVKKRLHINHFERDLAADEHNTVAASYYSEQDNSLFQPWGTGWNWCNPPFADLKPWTEKAYEESQLGSHTAMLVPASAGANWWKQWVDKKAYVLILNGRLTFIGHSSPYPKDLALLLYTPPKFTGYEIWTWSAE